jgi:acyl dehydratase
MPERLHASYAPGERLAALSIAVDATLIVAGAIATRDFSPLHHDAGYARAQAGHRDIFLNTPTQLALVERYLAGTLGGHARIARLRARMTAPVYAGAALSIEATVHEGVVDAVGCGWLHMDIALHANGKPASRCAARVAVPVDEHDDPWRRRGVEWQP